MDKTAPMSLSAVLAAAEAAHLLKALELVEWERGRAARLLGITRKCLWEKLRRYQLAPPPGLPRRRSEMAKPLAHPDEVT